MVSKQTRRMELLIGLSVGFILFAFLVLHLATCTNIAGGEISKGLKEVLDHVYKMPFDIRLKASNLKLIFISLFLYLVMALAYYSTQVFKFGDMPGKEDGSARWNRDLASYDKRLTSPKGLPGHDGYSNIILSQDVRLSMEKWTGKNCNILCIGGSGAGKSRYFVKPNLLQANASFVVTDPSGELLESCGKFLEEQMGYKLKVFNTVKMEYSNCYNPFFYLKKETDVIIMIDSLIRNTTPEGAKKGDPFWEKSEVMLLRAVCYYLWLHCSKEKQNFSEVVKLIRLAAPADEDRDTSVPLDKYFHDLPDDDLAKEQYQSFRTGGNKTIKSIVISVLARLTIFDLDSVRELTSSDNIDLLEMGDEKQALFVIVPTGGIDSFSFLASMLYTQLFEGLYNHAEYDTKYSLICSNGAPVASFNTRAEGEALIERLSSSQMEEKESGVYCISYPAEASTGDREASRAVFREGSKEYISLLYENISKGITCERQSGTELPVPVRFILDEFANIGQIPNFAERLSTMRKYRISCTIIIQNLNQLQKNYERDVNTLIGNCDSIVFLGSGDVMDSMDSTCSKISQMLGRTTIRTRSQSHSKNARGGSSSNSMQQRGRPLLTPDEVSMIKDWECIIKIKGEYPFRCRKHDLVSHKNYKYTADDNEANSFILDSRKWHAAIISKNPIKKEPQKLSLGSAAMAMTKEDLLKSTGGKDLEDLTLESEEVNNPEYHQPVLDLTGSSNSDSKKDSNTEQPDDSDTWEYYTFR